MYFPYFIGALVICSMVFSLLISSPAFASTTLSVEVKDLENNQHIGHITFKQSEFGLVLIPKLTGLPEGLHGFHLHENPSCEPAIKDGKKALGGQAGGHYDPIGTGQHGTAWSADNHLGDLPPIYVNEQGQAIQPVLAPRLSIDDLSGRSIMIHAGGDNHADHPLPLGGGGARIACGVISTG